MRRTRSSVASPSATAALRSSTWDVRLERLRVRRFQSLHDVDLALGQLTVVVGPSNTGKSAFGRAVRQLVRNGRSSLVEHGEKTSTVEATLEDGTGVSLERGPSVSTYRVTTPSSEEVYAKAGTSVPEDVQRLFSMPAGDGPDVHLTTQFDGPYLLDVDATTASRVLGELTNVTLLSEAAREAVRRRGEAGRDARTRRVDAEAGVQRVRSEFSDLGERRDAVRAARETFEAVRGRLAQAEELTRQAEAARHAEQAVALAGEAVEVPIPDYEAIEDLVRSERNLREQAERCTMAAAAMSQQSTMAERATSTATELEERHFTLLREAGRCPTCLQPVTSTS